MSRPDGRDDLAGRRVDHGLGADHDGGNGLVATGDVPHMRRGGRVFPDVDLLYRHGLPVKYSRCADSGGK
jgi:hypothetical protein